MTRKTADDFHPEVLKLFDKFVHGDISRRGFLSSAAKFTVIGLTAEGLLEALSPKFAQAQQISNNDPRITATYVEYPSPAGYGKIRG
ncbi:MAG: dienelactone hydrolase family protein, partial [Methylococcaceae bacterium]|nr:dienelactone hydrolase family protein [Methylococcaceae bacterium]